MPPRERILIGYAEVHAFQGRSGIAVQLDRQILVIEFKVAKTSGEVDRKRREDAEQIKRLGYAKACEGTSRKVVAAVIIADGESRQATL